MVLCGSKYVLPKRTPHDTMYYFNADTQKHRYTDTQTNKLNTITLLCKINNPSRSLPRNRAGRLFRAGRPFRASAQPRNPPRDSEVPRSASLGPRETPYDTPGLPCSMLLVCLLSYPEGQVSPMLLYVGLTLGRTRLTSANPPSGTLRLG